VKRPTAGRAAGGKATTMGQGTCVRQNRVAPGLQSDEADRGKVRELHLHDRAHTLRMAAPTARPTMASSLKVASRTRPGYSFIRFLVALNRAPKAPNVLTVDEHARIVGQRAGLGFAMASR